MTGEWVPAEAAAAMVRRATPGVAFQALAAVGVVAAGVWVWDHREAIRETVTGWFAAPAPEPAQPYPVQQFGAGLYLMSDGSFQRAFGPFV